jgi:hypothetical protein
MKSLSEKLSKIIVKKRKKHEEITFNWGQIIFVDELGLKSLFLQFLSDSFLFVEN